MSKTLPELKSSIESQITEKQENQHFVRIQKYMRMLNKPPEKEELQKHPQADAYYLPISFIEMILDEAFFGLWSSQNFRWELIQNEIVGTIEVSVFHPVAKTWITRSGAAAKKIMMDKASDNLSREEKNKWALDLNHKKPSALDDLGGFAALKAGCFKNAVLSIGKIFGRDVNRDATKAYQPLAKDKSEEIKQIRNNISTYLRALPESESEQFIDQLVYAEDNNQIDLQGYKEKLQQVREKVHRQWEAAKKNMTAETLSQYDTEEKIIEHIKNKNNGE